LGKDESHRSRAATPTFSASERRRETRERRGGRGEREERREGGGREGRRAATKAGRQRGATKDMPAMGFGNEGGEAEKNDAGKTAGRVKDRCSTR